VLLCIARCPLVFLSYIGWRKPIRSLKLRVSFRKRATSYRALLRKMTNENKAMTLRHPVSVGGGDRISNIKDCQHFNQVFTGVPVNFKTVSTGVPKISN